MISVLLNAFLFKDVHSLLMHDHNHDHDSIEHDVFCKSQTHIHEIEYVLSDCFICDFNFSPSEKIDQIVFSESLINISSEVIFQEEKSFISYFKPFISLRGPPVLDI